MTKEQKAKLEKNRPNAKNAAKEKKNSDKRHTSSIIGVPVKESEIKWANRPTKK
ncbi:MAG: hypothetical protein J6Y78_15330 [Paludibacteraceae bacterium]|nr:hypothetical protein [Paludibacteraceae bacterium]